MKMTKMCLACAATTLALVSTVSGGPLTPPAGPVTSTGKTLQQVEPRTPIDSLPGTAVSMYKITQPGSYYLTGNINLSAGKTTCIEVGVDGVTIDLNGFTLNGLNTNATTAIRAEDKFACDGLRVHNGHITDWGIGIDGTGLYGGVFEDLRLTFNDQFGLDAGYHGVVSRCSAVVCGSGIYLRQGGTASKCTASFCGIGIDMGLGGTASDSQASSCGFGFFLSVGCSAGTCVAHSCSVGFGGNDRNTLTDCTASLCNDGISVAQASRVSGCHVGGGSGPGIGVSHGSTVERCTVNGQGLRGIIAGDKCSISDNRVEFCGGAGIHVIGLATMVTGNNVQRCELDVGILIEGDDNQLELNRVEGSGLEGIKVVGTRNLVVRNRVCASARTTGGLTFLDYSIPAGNHAGSVLLPSSFVTTAEQNANYACGFVPPDPIRTGQAGAPAGAAAALAPASSSHPERATPAVPGR
jgi:hypothetical protein